MGNMTGHYQQAKEQVEYALARMAADYEAREKKLNEHPESNKHIVRDHYLAPSFEDRARLAQAMALVGILGHLDTNRQHESEDADKIASAIKTAQHTGIRESSMEFYYMEKMNRIERRRRKLRRWRRQLGHKIGGTTEANGAHDA